MSDCRVVVAAWADVPSLPLKGFAIVIMLFFALITIPLAALVGTILLWGLLPFALMAIAALWWGLRRSYRDGEVLEVLEIDGNDLVLTRTEPDIMFSATLQPALPCIVTSASLFMPAVK